MTAVDSLHRFVVEGSPVRGELVRLDSTWRAVLERHTYPAPVQAVLGECLAAVALLAATIKFEGTVTLQASGGGPLSLMVVEATHRRTLRALARFEAPLPDDADLPSLLGEGRLAITVDPGEGKEQYQGIVDVQGKTLADALQSYFERSEQLPTRLWLAAHDSRAAGLLLQRLPGEEQAMEEDADAWRRSQMLTDTVTARELLELEAKALLWRLYSQERIRLFSPEPWQFHCTCSRERVRTMLHALGPEELESILAEEGQVSVDCEFCSATYGFDEVDVGELLAGDTVASPSSTSKM